MPVYKSIKETQKLFRIEGLEGGQVNIRTSKYLLSLSEQEQAAVLKKQLGRLKEDLDNLEALTTDGLAQASDELDRTQLQLLIQVTENLITQI